MHSRKVWHPNPPFSSRGRKEEPTTLPTNAESLSVLFHGTLRRFHGELPVRTEPHARPGGRRRHGGDAEDIVVGHRSTAATSPRSSPYRAPRASSPHRALAASLLGERRPHPSTPSTARLPPRQVPSPPSPPRRRRPRVGRSGSAPASLPALPSSLIALPSSSGPPRHHCRAQPWSASSLPCAASFPPPSEIR